MGACNVCPLWASSSGIHGVCSKYSFVRLQDLGFVKVADLCCCCSAAPVTGPPTHVEGDIRGEEVHPNPNPPSKVWPKDFARWVTACGRLLELFGLLLAGGVFRHVALDACSAAISQDHRNWAHSMFKANMASAMGTHLCNILQLCSEVQTSVHVPFG